MAHTCPQCGCYCTCSGDWDDLDLHMEPARGCIHWRSADCTFDEIDPDDGDFEARGPLPQFLSRNPNCVQLTLF
jgi:hypothetical protein